MEMSGERPEMVMSKTSTPKLKSGKGQMPHNLLKKQQLKRLEIKPANILVPYSNTARVQGHAVMGKDSKFDSEPITLIPFHTISSYTYEPPEVQFATIFPAPIFKFSFLFDLTACPAICGLFNGEAAEWEIEAEGMDRVQPDDSLVLTSPEGGENNRGLTIGTVIYYALHFVSFAGIILFSNGISSMLKYFWKWLFGNK